jgi:hypothetical protein
MFPYSQGPVVWFFSKKTAWKAIKIEILKIENFQPDGKFVSANHILQMEMGLKIERVLTCPVGMPNAVLRSSERSPGFFSFSFVSNSFP